MAVNRFMYFAMGALLGAGGAAAASGDPKARQALNNLLGAGFNLKESLLARMDSLREDVEDSLAEARFSHESHAEKQAAQATAKAAPKSKAGGNTKTAAVQKATPKKTAATAKAAAKSSTAKKATGTKSATAPKKAAAAKKPVAKKAAPKKTAGKTTSKAKATATRPAAAKTGK